MTLRSHTSGTSTRLAYAYFDTVAGAPLGASIFTAPVQSMELRLANRAPVATVACANYINTSSIDLLRYALTGGNRVVDTGTTTTRACLPAGLPESARRYLLPCQEDTSRPRRQGYAGDGERNGALQRRRVRWRVLGPSVFWYLEELRRLCYTAATTTSGDLNRRVLNPSTLQTGKVLYGNAIPSTAISPTLGTITWEISSSPTRTLDHARTAGLTTDTFTYYASTTGTTRTAPPVGSGLSNATVSLSYTLVTTGTTTASSAVAASTYPMLGSEPDRSIQGYTTASLSTGMYDTNSPPLTQVAPGSGTPFVITNSSTTRAYTVCKNGARIFGPISGGNPSSSGVNDSWCSSKLSGSTSTTLGSALGLDQPQRQCDQDVLPHGECHPLLQEIHDHQEHAELGVSAPAGTSMTSGSTIPTTRAPRRCRRMRGSPSATMPKGHPARPP